MLFDLIRYSVRSFIRNNEVFHIGSWKEKGTTKEMRALDLVDFTLFVFTLLMRGNETFENIFFFVDY